MMMILRKATPSNNPAIKTCVEASLNATYGGLWISEPLLAGDADWPSAWGACVADRIIGVGLSEADVISDLWVHPSDQGLGGGIYAPGRLGG